MVKKLKYQDAVKKDECALITEIVCRRIAQPLAILAYKLGLTANFVTLLRTVLDYFNPACRTGRIRVWLRKGGVRTFAMVSLRFSVECRLLA